MTQENKSLSQQICELCEIEARARGCTDDRTGCKGDCDDCTWYDPDKYYPNFENPENFVKLLELMANNGVAFSFELLGWFNNKTIFRIGCRFDENDDTLTSQDNTFKDTYLRFIMLILKTDKADNIKEIIREYDGWVRG